CAPEAPEELAGAFFPELGAVVADGTEPRGAAGLLPLAVERYVDLGAYGDAAALKAKRGELRRLAEAVLAPQTRVARGLAAARALADERFDAALDGDVPPILARRARGIIAREIRPGGGGAAHKRFLSALTPDGPVCLFETARELCGRIYELNDNYGLAPFLLAPLLAAALDAGQEAYACYCPLHPEEQLEHLLLPGLDLGFVSSSDPLPYDGVPFRRMRLDACPDAERIRAQRSRLRFLHKTERALLDDAAAALGEARTARERLADCYAAHMDFAAAEAAAERLAAALVGDEGSFLPLTSPRPV
ncbi:MAG: hypothetical protein LBT60_02680, partial [Oscillospiraceae bacterium]|nr:hypothetical protein [Oscillospiraceae bacterium]